MIFDAKKIDKPKRVYAKNENVQKSITALKMRIISLNIQITILANQIKHTTTQAHTYTNKSNKNKPKTNKQTLKSSVGKKNLFYWMDIIRKSNVAESINSKKKTSKQASKPKIAFSHNIMLPLDCINLYVTCEDASMCL